MPRAARRPSPSFPRASGGTSAVRRRKPGSRGGKPGRALEDRTRQDLYKVAKRKGIEGRSKMGKWDLIEAIRKAG